MPRQEDVAEEKIGSSSSAQHKEGDSKMFAEDKIDTNEEGGGRSASFSLLSPPPPPPPPPPPWLRPTKMKSAASIVLYTMR